MIADRDRCVCDRERDWRKKDVFSEDDSTARLSGTDRLWEGGLRERMLGSKCLTNHVGMTDRLLLLYASISDVYGILAPLESFMHVPPDLCHQHFYEVSRLCRRSLVFTL